MTIINDHLDLDRPTVLSPGLEAEIHRDERETEFYGGDDPHDPKDLKKPADAELVDANLVTWDGPNDQANPQNWSKRYKWFVTLVCCVMTVNVTFASSAPTTTSASVSAAFHVSTELTYLITSFFLLGYVTGPVIWGPGSELLGRRPIFIFCMVFYTLLHLPQALAPNITCLLIARFFGGVFAVAPLVNCGGVIADVWDGAGRGPATSLFTACVFVGPVLGPIVGGFLVESTLGWRWVYWIMMIFAGVCTAIMVVCLPETFAPVILQRKAVALRRASPSNPAPNAELYAEHEKQDWSPRGVLHRTLYRPFIMLAQEPILVLVTIYLSLIYGVLYALFEAFPLIFIAKHGFTLSQSGLVFIGVGVGTSIGAWLNLMLSRHYPVLMIKWRGFPPPEERLYGAMVGALAFVVGIFWVGWSGNYASVPWAVPAVGTILIGMSVSLIFISLLSYLIDTYLMFASSAFAANTIIRSAVAAAFPLFTVQMFQGMGVGWACTLLGLVGLLLTPAPFLFYRYGARIRGRSTFAPGVDLKIAKEMAEGKQSANGEKESV
ncbi:MFS general substrate transporter [Athelia psychrophila]|uniref:MFS general substrate transporter n=1 Tax=Athelia psychrophila TaxID=1759441 RepID=A0A166P3C3_9AGAM|nr:MFS general substrate transporter [Fibularhizoctonia sp. CBS 109695]